MSTGRRVIKKYSGRLTLQPFTKKEVQPFVGKTEQICIEHSMILFVEEKGQISLCTFR